MLHSLNPSINDIPNPPISPPPAFSSPPPPLHLSLSIRERKHESLKYVMCAKHAWIESMVEQPAYLFMAGWEGFQVFNRAPAAAGGAFAASNALWRFLLSSYSLAPLRSINRPALTQLFSINLNLFLPSPPSLPSRTIHQINLNQTKPNQFTNRPTYLPTSVNTPFPA